MSTETMVENLFIKKFICINIGNKKNFYFKLKFANFSKTKQHYYGN